MSGQTRSADKPPRPVSAGLVIYPYQRRKFMDISTRLKCNTYPNTQVYH